MRPASAVSGALDFPCRSTSSLRQRQAPRTHFRPVDSQFHRNPFEQSAGATIFRAPGCKDDDLVAVFARYVQLPHGVSLSVRRSLRGVADFTHVVRPWRQLSDAAESDHGTHDGAPDALEKVAVRLGLPVRRRGCVLQ